MSIEAIKWALTDAPLKNSMEFAVLQGLANHAHADGKNAFPSVAKLASYARADERTVRRVLRELESRGVIHKGNQGIVAALIADPRYRPTCYDLNMSLGEESRGDTVPPLTNLGGAAMQSRGGAGAVLGGAQRPPNQNLKPNGEPPPPGRDEKLTGSDSSGTTEEAEGKASKTPDIALAEETPVSDTMLASDQHRDLTEVLAATSGAWGFGKRGRAQITAPVLRALKAGWSASHLIPVLTRNLDGARRPVAVVLARLDDLPEPPAKTRMIRPQCGACNPSRWIEHPETGRDMHRCPTCHPAYTQTHHIRSAA